MRRSAIYLVPGLVLAGWLGGCSDRSPQPVPASQPALTQPGIDPAVAGEVPPPPPLTPDVTPELRRDLEALLHALESRDFVTAIQYFDPEDLGKATALDIERGMSDLSRARLIEVLRAALKARVLPTAEDRAVIGKEDLGLADPDVPGMRFRKVEGRWRLRKKSER